MKQKKNALLCITGILIIGLIGVIWNTNQETVYDGQNLGGMYIEEKDYHVEPGEYQQMWIIGHSAYEDNAHRETFKVFIENPLVFNLIQEGEEYVVLFSANHKDEEDNLIYSLDWIGAPEPGSQMRGDGLINKE